MDCRQVKKLLPLWVGQDLPDAATANDVSSHLERCCECEKRRIGLQNSLEVLQGSSAETLSIEPSRQSLWPKLATRISAWESPQHRDRFNGWIPASVMALAVALMVAVSIPSMHDVFFGNETSTANSIDLYGTDSDFRLDSELKLDHPLNSSHANPARGTPVVYRPEQW